MKKNLAGPGSPRPGDKLRYNIKSLVMLAVVALLLTSLTGCSAFKGLFGDSGQTIEVPPQELAQLGMEALQAERYTTAVQHFQDLRDRYPYSRYAILAELKLADANYLAGNYIEAADAYAQFEQLHPNNEAIPYVIYQQGMSFFQQMPEYNRDQSPTIRAIQTFTRLRQTFPDSRFSAMAEGRLTEAQKTLAAHEFFVGEFYFRTEQYNAALGRFTNLLKAFPDAGYHNQAMNYIILSRQKLAEEEASGKPKEKLALTEAKKKGQTDESLKPAVSGETR